MLIGMKYVALKNGTGDEMNNDGFTLKRHCVTALIVVTVMSVFGVGGQHLWRKERPAGVWLTEDLARLGSWPVNQFVFLAVRTVTFGLCFGGGFGGGMISSGGVSICSGPISK